MAAWWDTHPTQAYLWGWNPGSGKQRGSVSAHSGLDLAEVNGTPLTSAVSGEVIVAGAYRWGGQVSIRFQTGNQDYTLSYLHLSDIAVVVGQHVTVGQYIGKTGGASWSSPIPTRCCSGGPHLHFELWVGDHAPYAGPHGQSPWQPDQAHHPIDPTPFWSALKAAGGPTNDQSGLGHTLGGSMSAASAAQSSAAMSATVAAPEGNSSGAMAHMWLQELPGFAGIAYAADAAEYIPPLNPPAAPAQQQGNWFTNTVGITGAQNAVADARYAGATAGSIFSWLGKAASALLLRGLLVLLGLGLCAALLYSLARRSSLMPDSEQAADAAKLALLL